MGLETTVRALEFTNDRLRCALAGDLDALDRYRAAGERVRVGETIASVETNAAALACGLANLISVSARDPGPMIAPTSRAVLAWLRWNDRDGDYPDGWTAAEAALALINVFAEEPALARAAVVLG